MRWVYLAIVIVFVAALIIFVLQNTQSVNIAFIALSVTLPLAVLVFIVYVLGALSGGSLLRASQTIGRRLATRLIGRSLRCAPWCWIGAPLAMRERPDPAPGPGEIRIRVAACGVCRTDLHVVDGELPRADADRSRP